MSCDLTIENQQSEIKNHLMLFVRNFSCYASSFSVYYLRKLSYLLIDYAHMRRREGDPPREAIEKAASNKFKPILMMNLAIVLAMLPQALALGSGGEIRAPFAITAIGGILVSMLLTLFVIPSLYVLTARKAMIGE